jgi:hypothetical protein
MRKRIYFLLPNTRRAKAMFNELLLARIEERHIHTMAKEGTGLDGLPEATVLQRSDAVHAAGLGLLVGGFTGAAAGGFELAFPPTGLSMGFGVVLAMSLLGAIMGVWVAGMIGSSAPSTHLQRFAGDIENGKVLLIVDVPHRRVEEITALIGKHPDADVRGLHPTIPAFP